MSLRDGQLGRYTLSRNAEQLAIAAAGTAALDIRYLRLNASNDPVTGQLAIHPTAAYRSATRYQRLTIGEADTADNVGIHFVAGATPTVYSVAYIGAINATASTYDSGPNGNWSVPGRINKLDGVASQATCNKDYNYPSDILRLTINSGTSIPANAVIVGWYLYVRRQADNGAGSGSNWLRDYRVGMMMGDNWIGDNKLDPNHWSDDWEDAYYGSSGDAWGAGITAANVNAGDISVGIQIQAYKSGLAVPAGKVDYVELVCYYTLGNEWVAGYDASSGAFSIKPGRAIASYFDFSPSGALTIPALTGVAPLTISSTTLNPNLNADLLDGYHASSFVLTSATHNILSATHADSTAASVVRGDIITGQGATPKWTRLAVGSANAFLRTDGTDVAWSTGFLSITAAKTLTVSNTLTLAGTDSKSLTLTGSLTVGADTSITGGGTLALGGYTLTVPESMTTAGRNVANTFTAAQLVKLDSYTAFHVQNTSAAPIISVDTIQMRVAIGASTSASSTFQIEAQTPGDYQFGMTAKGREYGVIQRYSGGVALGGIIFDFDANCVGSYNGSTTAEGGANIRFDTRSGQPGIVFQAKPAGSAYPSTTEYYRMVITMGGLVGIGINAPTTKLQVVGASDIQQFLVIGHTTQATATAMAQLTRNDTAAGVSAILGLTGLGSGAAGDGGSILYKGKTSTTAASNMGRDRWYFVDATHATYTVARVLSVYDAGGERDALTLTATGSAATLTFGGNAYAKADSRKVFWGAGDDLSIYYDGTSGYIKADEVAASDVHLTTGAAKTLVLDTPVYNDANVGSLVLVTGGTLPGVVELLESDGGASGIYSRGFAVNEQGSGSLEMPHDYKEGSDIVFHVHWVGQDAPTGTDNVRWRLTYSVTRDGVVTPATTTVVDADDTPFDTQYEWMRTDVATITGTNFKIGDQFNFTITRIAASGDAYAGEAVVATIGFHYQCDTIGSRQIGTK